MNTIYFIPHATSLDNLAGLASGHYDVELSERGREQALEERPMLRGLGVDAVYTSDLRRAHETAEIVFKDTGTPIIMDPRLRECDYGDLTRSPRAEVTKARVDAVKEPFPNGESYMQVVERVGSFLGYMRTAYTDSSILVIGHFATVVGLEYWLRGKPVEESFLLDYNMVEFPLRYVVE